MSITRKDVKVLITEAKDFDVHKVDTIVESIKTEDGITKKCYYIEGPYVQCNIKNRNGRIYSKELMEQVVDQYKNERMNPQTGFRSFGELGHPEGVDINLDKVCHYTTQLEWNGNDCIGKSKVLSSHPMGRILETFLEEKLVVGVSTRGLGALAEEQNPDGSKNVEAYQMIAIDSVADPSAPKGFVDGIYENKQYIVKDNGVILECYENFEKQLQILPNKTEERAQKFLEIFNNFINDFKTK